MNLRAPSSLLAASASSPRNPRRPSHPLPGKDSFQKEAQTTSSRRPKRPDQTPLKEHGGSTSKTQRTQTLPSSHKHSPSTHSQQRTSPSVSRERRSRYSRTTTSSLSRYSCPNLKMKHEDMVSLLRQRCTSSSSSTVLSPSHPVDAHTFPASASVSANYMTHSSYPAAGSATHSCTCVLSPIKNPI